MDHTHTLVVLNHFTIPAFDAMPRIWGAKEAAERVNRACIHTKQPCQHYVGITGGLQATGALPLHHNSIQLAVMGAGLRGGTCCWCLRGEANRRVVTAHKASMKAKQRPEAHNAVIISLCEWKGVEVGLTSEGELAQTTARSGRGKPTYRFEPNQSSIFP